MIERETSEPLMPHIVHKDFRSEPIMEIREHDKEPSYQEFLRAKSIGFPGWPEKATVENCFTPIKPIIFPDEQTPR